MLELFCFILEERKFRCPFLKLETLKDIIKVSGVFLEIEVQEPPQVDKISSPDKISLLIFSSFAVSFNCKKHC